jgi:hypothetical protein
MFTLRCTQKLLRRGIPAPATEDTTPSTLLGDWYANILFSKPQQLVLCISERTLLPVIVPAKDIRQLASRVREMAITVLTELGIDAAAVKAEAERMQSSLVGRTANKRVLGSLNDFMFQLEHGLHMAPERSLLEHALWLAETPCKPIEYASPDRATIALFNSSSVIQGAREKSAL